MNLLRTIGVRIVTAALVLAVVAAGVVWWQLAPEARGRVTNVAGGYLAWAALTALLPWATFFLSVFAANRRSNIAGAGLVLSYTVVSGLALAWLTDFSIGGAVGVISFLAAVLTAGVYNLLVCDFIADRIVG